MLRWILEQDSLFGAEVLPVYAFFSGQVFYHGAYHSLRQGDCWIVRRVSSLSYTSRVKINLQ